MTPDADTLEALQKLFGRGNVRLVRRVRPVFDDEEPFWRRKQREAQG